MSGSLVVLLGALALDLLLGDPATPWHPVAVFGRAAGWCGQILRRRCRTPRQQKAAGLLLVLVGTGSVFGVAFLLLQGAEMLGRPFFLVAASLLLWTAVSIKSLRRAACEVLVPLARGDLPEARARLSLIVSRETGHLDAREIVRATVETVAENISDGIIAPLFYFLLGGAPLAWAYRAVNTLDAMFGYKEEPYLHFGWAAARCDDLWNYLPARLTAFLILAAAFLCRWDWRGGLAAVLRDAAKHPSPNSGYPEAAVAGVLGVQLGGYNYYHGKRTFRPYLGEARRELEPSQITAALRVMEATVALGVALFALVLILAGKGIS